MGLHSIYMYTDHLIPENFGSQPPTSHQEEKKKHFCPRGWNNLGFAFVAMNPGTKKKHTSSGSSRLTAKFLHDSFGSDSL